MFLIGEVAGMSDLVSALQGILTTDAFMGALSALVPVIGGVLLFAFVYRITRKLVKGASKGKANI